ncbi:MAG TPA: 50S ribosomal protein L13 [Candidatus Nanoarchaeia archaeon]|nr:50S ribosomal protein L13 [Candidatus Nanoarchaeia archaeon]
MKVIDGEGAVMGRLASYAAKESLKGEEVAVVNCEKIIITGNRKDIKENFEARRKRVGSTQKGPKYSRTPEKIVKKVMRGMLPNARHSGRGRDAFKRIKCYVGVPKEFENSEKINLKQTKNKFLTVKEVSKILK